MEVNYSLLGVILIVVIVLFFLFIKRNKKDRETLEQELNALDMDPEKHKDEESEL